MIYMFTLLNQDRFYPLSGVISSHIKLFLMYLKTLPMMLLLLCVTLKEVECASETSFAKAGKYPQLKSRFPFFNSLYGVTEEIKDYLSLTKDQGQEGLCWAYSLSSAMELSYALQTGNRFKIDPVFFKNNSAQWFVDHFDELKSESPEHADFAKTCQKYDDIGGYSQLCALIYAQESQCQPSLAYNPNVKAPFRIKDSDVLEITSLESLKNELQAHKFLYNGVYADDLFMSSYILDEYTTGDIDHGIVITGLGQFTGDYALAYPGWYVEILNSWGVEHGYDGLQYVKVADDDESTFANPFNLWDFSFWLEVEEVPVETTKPDDSKPGSSPSSSVGAWRACAIVFIVCFIALAAADVAYYMIKIRRPDMQPIEDEPVAA